MNYYLILTIKYLLRLINFIVKITNKIIILIKNLMQIAFYGAIFFVIWWLYKVWFFDTLYQIAKWILDVL